MPAAKLIEKDILRTMPNNACFLSLDSTGVPRLRRILRAVAYLFPDIGYCQGMGQIVCSLLLVMEEEDAFWMMVTLIEDILPASYFCNSLIGIQADQQVLRQLIAGYLPDIDGVLQRNDIELSLISLHWFITMFASVVHMKVLVRLWDVLFYEGSVALFHFSLAALKSREAALKDCGCSAALFNILSDIPCSIEDADAFLHLAYNVVATNLTETMIASHRKKHLAALMTEQGALVPTDDLDSITLPKQQVQRRSKLSRSTSVLSSLFPASSTASGLERTGVKSSGFSLFNSAAAEEARLKNVRQTETLVDLKEAILRLGRHFLSVDVARGGGVATPAAAIPMNLQAAHSRRLSSTDSIGSIPLAPAWNITPDYSLESHAHDHDNFLQVHRSRRKRARALLDFERHDEDELGFRKNDVVTIVSQKDEHCWVGELHGCRGWFPAKFVEMLDERSKAYSPLGDDAVHPEVTDLVRGHFCTHFKSVFVHGIKTSGLIGGPVHPWLFIEDVAKREVQRDFDSVYSRLVLCRTFKLDADGKVLTPEELLYKCVQAINVSHDSVHAQMDVKFRSLVSMGLNEQVLHLWFELLCSSNEAVRKWYHRWSFIRSPCWVQIKCELRVLAQFAFNLNPDWELASTPSKGATKQLVKTLIDTKTALAEESSAKPLREGVRDMLVKHHLFSWDL